YYLRPELLDIQVFSTNLKSIFAGKKLLKILKDIYRSGKEIRFLFSNKALTDRMRNANVKLKPEDKGIDALDKVLNYKYLKSIFNRKARIKNVLTDQKYIRGIGNSYSDEILWQAGITPFSTVNAIHDDKIKELASTIKKVLSDEVANILKKYPGLIHGEVKDFMKIHSKTKTHSPTGAPIK
ncbi:MAG: Fpg/Nei family DNA glycosylase, partial [Ginsengibacter sp.]